MNQSLRWHPLQKEWVIISPKRKKRFTTDNPFASTSPEMKGKTYPALLENKYPNFHFNDLPKDQKNGIYQTMPANGTSDIIVETINEDGDFEDYTLEEIIKIINLINERNIELESNEQIKFTFVFKNKGPSVGASLSHPHLQIYGMPYVPPYFLRAMESSKDYFISNGSSLFDDIIIEEKENNSRIIHEDDTFISFVPFFARWPYECHILSKKSCERLADFSTDEISLLANQIKIVNACHNNLFSHKMEYVMLFHHSPCRENNGHYRFYIEFQPLYQLANRPKKAAGIERAGSFEFGSGTPESNAKDMIKVLQDFNL